MKVYKYVEFLFEGNTPEDYIVNCLQKIEGRLKEAFNQEENGDKVKKISDFSKFNLSLEDISLHTHTFSEKNLTCKFSDSEGVLYILNVRMSVEDAVNKDKNVDFNTSDIKKAHVTFKRYTSENGSLDLDPNQMNDTTVDPEMIDGDFLIKIKQDLDKGKDPGQEQEFKIETDEDAPTEETPPAQGSAQTSNQNTPQETV
jgi:hypothetical protein